jgi:hypothetical protein
MKKISNIEIEHIFRFVRDEVYKHKRQLRPYEWNKITVALPDWLAYFILDSPRVVVNDSGLPHDRYPSSFYGVKRQPHYKDEIVVFYDDFHYNPELFKPSIYQFKIEH